MAATAPQGGQAPTTMTPHDGQSYGFAFAAMTVLFFFWGFITVLNDILIPKLKKAFDLSYTEAMLVQFCFFGAYFIISPLAGRIVDKMGYQKGIVVGLVTTAIGCLLFYPAAEIASYPVFLSALFILASGITILQVSANPYVAALGPSETAASRLNLAQALNSLGTTVGPMIGAALILGAATAGAESVQMPYVGIAVALLLAAALFAFIKLPKLEHVEGTSEDTVSAEESIWSHKSLLFGTGAIFVYVGGEVAIGSFLVNYLAEPTIAGMGEEEAGTMIAYYWGGAMIGRFIGAAVMRYIKPSVYLSLNAVVVMLLLAVTMSTSGSLAMWTVLGIGLFNAIMFPTIFTLAIQNLGPLTSKGSGLLCQAIVGGALIPLVQGMAADSIGVQLSFMVPVACYAYIAWYGKWHTSQSS